MPFTYTDECKGKVREIVTRLYAQGKTWHEIHHEVHQHTSYKGAFEPFILTLDRWGIKQQLPEREPPPPKQKEIKSVEQRDHGERVRWTDDERDKLLEQVYTMRQNRPDEPLWTLCNDVMSQWPIERRRHLSGRDQVIWVTEALAKRYLEDREELRRLRAVKPPEPQITYVHTPKTELLADLSLTELAYEFITRMAAGVEQAQYIAKANNDLLLKLLSRGHVVVAPTNVLPKERKPVFSIVGLLPNQKNEVISAVGERATLHFREGDELNRDLPNSDRYFLFTKFISHGWQHRIKDRDKLMFVAGGVGTLIHEIEEALKAA